MLTAVAVLQLVVSVALCCWIAVQERKISDQAAKIRILEEVLGNFGQQLETVTTQAKQSTEVREIHNAIASEQRKQPVKARNFSQFRSAAEEKFIA